jgi:arylsulfatase
MPRWGRVGKQKVTDEGPLPPFPDMSNVANMHDLPFLKAKHNMTTFDEELVKKSCGFMDKAKQDGKPFFVWHNTTRMHVWTFLSPKYRAMQNSKTNYGLEEAGVAQMDDCIGDLLKHLEEIGEADNTIVVFTTDNGAETFTWPDGGNTPFKGQKGTSYEGGFRAPCIARWPNKIKAGTVENGMMSALDWYPTLVAAAGNANVTDQLLKGVKLGDREYKNHLDGYNQLDMLTGKGPSKRHEFFYFSGPALGAVRLDEMKFQFLQQPTGWPGPKVSTDMPGLTNLRQDPFERFPMIAGESALTGAFGYGNDFFAREFWRFVIVQEKVAELAKTAIDYPPMQDPASFNLDAVKKKIEAMIREKNAR